MQFERLIKYSCIILKASACPGLAWFSSCSRSCGHLPAELVGLKLPNLLLGLGLVIHLKADRVTRVLRQGEAGRAGLVLPFGSFLGPLQWWLCRCLHLTGFLDFWCPLTHLEGVNSFSTCLIQSATVARFSQSSGQLLRQVACKSKNICNP